MSRIERPVNEIDYGSVIVDFSKNGIIINANDDFCRITGYDKNEFLSGKITFISLIPAEDIPSMMQAVEHLRTQGSGIIEHRMITKSGSLIHVICVCEEYDIGDGHVVPKMMICDITKGIQLEEKYRHSQAELKILMENIPGGVVLYEIDGDILRVAQANDEYFHILGYEDKSLHKRTVGHLMREGDLPKFMTKAKEAISTDSSFSFEVKISRYDLKPSWVKFIGKPFGTSEKGNPLIYGILVDISSEKKAERMILNQSERFKVIAESTDEIYFDYDAVNDVMHFENCVCGYGDVSEGIKGYWNELKCKKFIHPKDFDSYLKSWVNICKVPHSGKLEFRTKSLDDDYTWYRMPFVSVANEVGEITNVYGRLYSIDHMKKLRSKVKSDKAEIERLSTTDPVTGLLNRNAFKERASEILKNHFDSSKCYGILYSDINDFSYVNDNFGFEAGNEMLHDFAQIIRESEAFICACRLYSDYYIGLYRMDTREKLIDTIRLRNDTFTETQKKKYPASDLHVSCGLYIINSPDVDITIAMDNANLARRSVKGSKDVPCGIYTEQMRKRRSHEQAIASELRSAITSGQLELFLQPKFDLKTRKIIGAEALSRWRNPDGTYKLPYEFIGVLENVGYIVELDRYIFEQVLKCMSKWKADGKELLPISVNFSRLHNNYKDFVDNITNLTDSYDIDRELIEIEVTESCFTQDVNTLFANMRKLRERGFKIDIDDFGMGYSSLSVLLNAPVDIVKVDKVFIDSIATSAQARNYINQICCLIDTTKKDVIFEGVETEQQAIILANCGHKMAQGWLFDKAIPVSQFEEKYVYV